jgi:hypothetical protein
MKIVFTLLFLVSFKSFAQLRADICKSIQDIAMMERLGHERIANRENVTMVSNNFDVKYYRCEWEVDPAIRYIKGIVTVYYITTSATNFIALDLMNELTTDSVRQHNILLTKSQANNTLTINFPGNVNPGTFDSVSIFYQGVPPNTGFGSFVQAVHAGIPVLWSLSEPYGSRDWWPCKNGLDDKADSIDVYITNPIAYKAASNGILQSQDPVSGGTKLLTHWKHRYPIASYLICFAVTNYVVLNRTVSLSTGILPMQTFCYPEDSTGFSNGTINTLNAMQLYDTTFAPYPFMNEKYGHVQFNWGGGMEHQTSTFVVSIDEGLCAHELGHQWFGDKVTCGSWKDIWLNEGFATHLASIYNEKKYPGSITSTRLNEISNITSQPGGSVEVDDTTNVGRIFDSRLSYTKGSHLLYMLRWIMGDNTFFGAIKHYLSDPAVSYGFARTSDLQRNLEQASGLNLTSFFNEWFSGQGYPTYNVQWTNIGSGNVWIKMNQVTSHVSVPFFELPVALKFTNATQQGTLVVNNSVNGEIIIKHIGFVADTVLIDPEAWLITRGNTTQKLPGVLPVILQRFTVSKNGCNAFINFSTSLETNLASFHIETSNDGIVFTNAASVQAAGNSNSEKNYSYQFQMQPGKDYFFRLKMIDQDGAISYSNMLSLKDCANDRLRILLTPNPAKDLVTVSGLPAGKNILLLYSFNGQLLQTIHPIADFATIDLAHYASGLYMVRIQDAKGNWTNEKIVKE